MTPASSLTDTSFALKREASMDALRPAAIHERKPVAMTQFMEHLLRCVCAGPMWEYTEYQVLGMSTDEKIEYLRKQFCIACFKAAIPLVEIARVLRRSDAAVREMIGIGGRV